MNHMNKKISPTLIGTFVVGAVALVVIAVLAFGSGRLFRQTKGFILYFDNSVNGLRVGAPVKFKGVEIGSVTNILLQLGKDMKVQTVPVIIELDLKKIQRKGGSVEGLEDPETVEQAIRQGLRGRLEAESLLTGLLYVSLDFFPGSPVRLFQPPDSQYDEIPTMPTALEQARDTVNQILAKLGEIDFKGVTRSVTETADSVSRFVNLPALQSAIQALNQTMPKLDETIVNIGKLTTTMDGNVKSLSGDIRQTSAAARDALERIQTAVAGLQAVVDPDSPTFYELGRSLREVSAAARSLRLLANYLERNPRAMIFGKPEAQEEK